LQHILLATGGAIPPAFLRNFAANLASEVANGDMAADALRVENGVVKSAPEYFRANNPVRPPGTEAPDLNIAPHWYTTPEAQKDLASNTRNPFKFGVAMHEYQDSFSHWQKLGKPDTPQGIHVLHFKNQFEGKKKNIDKFDPINGTYKDIDGAMLTGMTSGFAYKRTKELARYQLQKIAHPK
jgi:hypothetical protein